MLHIKTITTTEKVMNTCPDCNGIGFVEHGHQGNTAMLPCHFCDSAGELDLDARLNDMEAAFANAFMYNGIAEQDAFEDVEF
jgi:hypothetical protein